METDRYLSEFKVKGSRPKSATLETYEYVLKPLDEFLVSNGLEIETLSPKEFEIFLTFQNWGNSHQRTALFATRSYLRWANFDPIKNPHPVHELRIEKGGLPQVGASENRRIRLFTY